MTEEKQKGVSADQKNSGKADVKKDGKIESLSAEIERDIMAGKLGPSGAPFWSTRMLAKKYGVSLVSAQRISVELRSRHLIRLEGKKFYLTYGMINVNMQGKRAARKKLIGIHIPNIESPYFTALARSAENVCRKNGYETILCSSGYHSEEEISALELFDRLGAAGVLSCPGRDAPLADFYRKFTLPTVFISNRIIGLENDCVSVDNHNAGEQVARFLIRQKYANFLYVSPEILRGGKDERLSGYVACLKAAGVEWSDLDVIYVEDKIDSFIENRIANAIMKKNYPVAVFCNNDLLALTVLRACHKWNFSVPDEVGIVGFDDLSIVSASMQALTTVHYSTQAIAEEAMKILLRRMAGGAYEGKVQRISSYLIRRNSTRLI